MRRIGWALVVAMSIGACGEDEPDDDRVQLGADFECLPRPDDATGYLQPICLYLKTELGAYDIDPNELLIETLESGENHPDGEPPTNTADYDWVGLSCCYTGDTAVIHRATREVVEFSLGPI